MKLVLILFIFATSIAITAYAAQTVTDRLEIDNDDIAAAVDFNNMLGYQIEAIGDLDGDGVVDLATIKFGYDGVAGDDSSTTNDFGSVLILFMNADGTVDSTNEIVMDATAAGLNGCIVGDGTNRDNGSLEQLAFVGDLDGDGEPTIALGANSNNHDTGSGVVADAGAVYMLELNDDGTVDNCVLITEDSSGFAPADGVYIQDGIANFGWPVIATDLNGDGQKELLVGANSESGLQTDLWPLFLTTTGTVSSHPAVPVSGLSIGVDSNEFMADGASVSGTKIVVSNENDGDGGGSVFIVNLSAAGAFVSTTEIAGSSITGIANDERFGSGVAPLGDMDNDGVNDILVSNEAGDDTNDTSGEVHILYLNSDDTLKESQKISNESENTRVASTPFALSDLFGHGMALWRDSGGSAIIAISAHQDDTGGETDSGAIYLFYVTRASSPTSDGGGGGSNEHKTRPTFGVDHNTFTQLVDPGLVINGESFIVTDNYWTHIPMQNLTVGDVQNFTATTYAPKTLRVMEFLFGIPEVGEWDKAEASVEVYLNYRGEIIEVIPKNAEETIADFSVLEYSSSISKCREDSNTATCNTVSVELSFNESPVGNVLAIQAIDYKGRNNLLYFNDGLYFSGASLNPPVTMQIPSEIKYKGLQVIERIDKATDTWITVDEKEPIEKYQRNSLGAFIPIQWREFTPLEDEVRMGMDRYHSEFDKIKQEQQIRAVAIFDSELIQESVGASFAYEFPETKERTYEISELIEFEKLRASEIFFMLFEDKGRN